MEVIKFFSRTLALGHQIELRKYFHELPSLVNYMENINNIRVDL
jgi:hypothetical protein